jgi:hypothetical protein
MVGIIVPTMIVGLVVFTAGISVRIILPGGVFQSVFRRVVVIAVAMVLMMPVSWAGKGAIGTPGLKA